MSPTPQATLVAPVTGEVIPLADVADPVFSSGALGEGYGVKPSGEGAVHVVAPVTGEVTMVAGTGHALGFKTDDGLEVLLHLGVDTVELEGRRYQSEEAGSARFTSAGTTGVATSGRMAYHDYQAGDDRLSFEDYGSGWECARGELLSRADYRIYPTNPAPETP